MKRDFGNRTSTEVEIEGEDLPEAGLLSERTEFSRRLESFGLGEGQSPLLTDCVWSLDVDGNQR